MSIPERLAEDMKRAMKARDAGRTSCIRMLRSRLLEREVELRSRHGRDYRISDEEALAAIAAYAKQRRDSIAEYEKGGRADLAAAERAELAIVNEYLPRQLSAEELRALVAEAVAEAGATTPKDLGAVMKILAPRTKGVADGKLVSDLVKAALS
jgi:uncharacterized protein YqeY